MATPVISVADVVVGESDPTAVFVITLSESSTQAVTVSYNTTNITALNGSDYTAVSGTLTSWRDLADGAGVAD